MAQIKITSIAAMKKAAVIIQRLGAKNVLIKGGHLPGNKRSGVIDILFNGDHYYEFSSPWIDTKILTVPAALMRQCWQRASLRGRILLTPQAGQNYGYCRD